MAEPETAIRITIARMITPIDMGFFTFATLIDTYVSIEIMLPKYIILL
jgi:hypothetical protein